MRIAFCFISIEIMSIFILAFITTRNTGRENKINKKDKGKITLNMQGKI
jgi:hypothetical protein